MTLDCNPATCPNGKCNATGECVDRPSAVRNQCCNKTVLVRCADCPHKAVFLDGWMTQEYERRRRSATQPESAGVTDANLHPEIPVSPVATQHDDEVNPKTLMGARRVDISLLPAAGIIHGAHAMMDGAAKYNPYNWREKKVPARTYISAAMRHLIDYLDGEEAAADSEVHHLGHVIGCCAIILDAMETGNLIDDRPNKGSAAAILSRLEAVLTARGARGA